MLERYFSAGGDLSVALLENYTVLHVKHAREEQI